MSYSGGSISAGKVVVNGNVTFTDSSSHVASLSAVQINADTVTASEINTAFFNYGQLDVSGNLEVSGNTTLNNLVVTGTATINDLSFSDLVVTNNLTVGNEISGPGGFLVDPSGNLTVNGLSSLNNLGVAVFSSLNELAVLGNAVFDGPGVVISGTTSVNDIDVSGNVVVAGSTTSGSLVVGGLSSLNDLDVSGNLMVVGTASLSSLQASEGVVFDKTLNVNQEFYFGSNGYVGGNMYVNNGINVGDGSNNLPGIVLFNGAISTPAGFSVNALGNVTVPGISTFNNQVNINENIAAVNEYLSGNIYSNNGVIVGDSDDNEGVKLISSGNTLSVMGGPYYTTDSSGNNIDGPFDSSANITVSTSTVYFNEYGSVNNGFTLNSEGGIINLTIDSSSQSVVMDSGISNKLPLNINGVKYNILMEDANTYETYGSTYKPGDFIGLNYKGTMTPTVNNAYFTALLTAAPPFGFGPLGSSFVPTITNNINFYEMVYWSGDSRSGDVVRMSATVCIPQVIISNTILSYKHGTPGSTYQKSTTWQQMLDVLTDASANQPEIQLVDFVSWMVSCAGYVTVIADNPGYGVSVNNYNYNDPYNETYSQYNAVVALSQLLTRSPELFNVTYTSPFNVINTGYSLGALISPFVSQLIARNPSFKLLNTIAGAPVNAYDLINTAVYDTSGNVRTIASTPGLTNLVYHFSLLYANTNPSLYGNQVGFLPNIVNNVVPVLNQLYLTTDAKIGNGLANEVSFTQYATGGAGVLDLSGNPYFSSAQGNPYFQPQALFTPTVPSSYGILKQSTFYTNIFADFSDLSGTPINVMYSLQDEFTCCNPATPYVGSSSTDLVNTPLSSFITTTNIPYGNGLNRTDYTNSVITSTLSSLSTDIVNQVTSLIFSERGLFHTGGKNNASNARFNTAALGGIGHLAFSLSAFQTIVRNYLIARLS